MFNKRNSLILINFGLVVFAPVSGWFEWPSDLLVYCCPTSAHKEEEFIPTEEAELIPTERSITIHIYDACGNEVIETRHITLEGQTTSLEGQTTLYDLLVQDGIEGARDVLKDGPTDYILHSDSSHIGKFMYQPICSLLKNSELPIVGIVSPVRVKIYGLNGNEIAAALMNPKLMLLQNLTKYCSQICAGSFYLVPCEAPLQTVFSNKPAVLLLDLLKEVTTNNRNYRNYIALNYIVISGCVEVEIRSADAKFGSEDTNRTKCRFPENKRLEEVYQVPPGREVDIWGSEQKILPAQYQNRTLRNLQDEHGNLVIYSRGPTSVWRIND